jgi:hypothetical protein
MVCTKTLKDTMSFRLSEGEANHGWFAPKLRYAEA